MNFYECLVRKPTIPQSSQMDCYSLVKPPALRPELTDHPLFQPRNRTQYRSTLVSLPNAQRSSCWNSNYIVWSMYCTSSHWNHRPEHKRQFCRIEWLSHTVMVVSIFKEPTMIESITYSGENQHEKASWWPKVKRCPLDFWEKVCCNVN